jgi:hypothetical protein
VNLSITIRDRMRAGSLVTLVEESDEALAVASAKTGAVQFQPIKMMSASDQEVMTAIENHKTGAGTLIISDFLRVYGGNAVAVRMIREIALQNRKAGEAFSRVILVESPGVEVPKVLIGDIEYVNPPLPSLPELIEELLEFAKQQGSPLEEKGQDTYAYAAAVSGLARHEAARLFARCIVENKELNASWLRREKAARVAERLGGALTFVDSDSAGVGGLDNLKKWLGARRGAFGSVKAKEYGLPESKGVLLLGIPGSGKSLTAKTVAREWGLPLLRLDAGKLFGSLVGQSESQTRQAIEAAESCAPCVLWVDEIEKGLAGTKGGGDSGTTQRVFGTLLTWLQEKSKPVFVVATANRVADLPPELLRKGRFDELFFVDLPTPEERKEIVKIHMNRRGRKPAQVTIDEIAQATEGFSGAEIEQAILEGMFTAFSSTREVAVNDIVEAAQGTVPLSKTMSEEIKALRQWASGRAKPATLPVSIPASQESGPIMRRPALKGA